MKFEFSKITHKFLFKVLKPVQKILLVVYLVFEVVNSTGSAIYQVRS